MNPTPDVLALIEKALERAYDLGKTYWQQADSLSYAENRRSDDTRAKFQQHVADTLAALSPPPAEPVPPSNDEVICPSCCHQFRAIPVNVQRLMLDAGFEPPFTDPPAVEETITAERIDRIAELVVKGMPDGISGFCKTWGWQQFARALLDICPLAHPTAEPVAWRVPTGYDMPKWLYTATKPREEDKAEPLYVHPPAEPARQVPPAEADWEEAVAINPSDIRKIHADPAAGQQAPVTEEMVTAYLQANDAYWKRIDAEPTKLGTWRNGTPREATRFSLEAALAPKAGQQAPLTEAQLWDMRSAAKSDPRTVDKHWFILYARAIEAAHGIAPKAKE